MKKVTFNSLPEAVSEILERMDEIEKLLKNRTKVSKERKSKAPKSKKSDIVNTDKETLSVKEASQLLNISQVNLYSYVRNKKIPFQKQNRRLSFSKVELEKWNKNRFEKSSPESAENITVKEAEKLLNIPSASIYYHIKSRKITPVAKKGKNFIFSKKELIGAFSKPDKKI